MENKTPKVLIGLPTMGNIHTILAMIIMSWVAENRVSIRVYPTLSVVPVDNARNAIVEEFLHGDAKDCTHLFFIDADTLPQQDALYKLLERDKDIVSGITPIIEYDEKTNEHFRKWNCIDLHDQHVKPHTGLHEIRGAGGSCLMIRREVFDKLQKPYFRFLYKDDDGKDVIVSEDIYFIAKALGAGFKAYADTDIICQHAKQVLW